MGSKWDNVIKPEVFLIMTYFPIPRFLWEEQCNSDFVHWISATSGHHEQFEVCERCLRKDTTFLASSTTSDFIFSGNP